MGVCARLPSACSECLPLCPPPQASTTGICALSLSSLRTQGASTAPTRGPKAPPEQILGDNRAPTWGALQLPKPRPEKWDQIQRLSSCIHASMHTIQIHGRRHESCTSSLPRAKSRAPFPAVPPPSQPCPPPQGVKAQLRKGAKERNPRLGGAGRCSSGPRPCRAVPTPTVPSSAKAGTHWCEGSCPALPEQSPPREPAAAHRASDKGERAAPSSKSALLHEGGLEDGVLFALGFSGAAASRSCVLNDLLG